MTRRILIWGASVLLIALIGWFAWEAAQPAPNASRGTLSVPVMAADNRSGPASASVTLVEYSDFQCPGCASFYPVIKQVLGEPAFAGKVLFAYRHFPLTGIHQNALPAARAAQAAAAQGKFWEMHDKLFEGQSGWSRLSVAAAHAVFEGYAADIGLDVARWNADLESDAVNDKLAADLAGGKSSGVDSTPSFFVNGTLVDVFAERDAVGAFRQALLDAVNATP